ncbi:MAG: hypothetical protein AB1746_17045, partial [Candidatus Zixiibacteriota bacterium]
MRQAGVCTLGLMMVILSIVFSASAQVPEVVNYQGHLVDDAGIPITGTLSMTFGIYDAASSGNQIWTQTFSSVNVTDGGFS